MTPQESIQRFLDEIKKRDEVATKGPWYNNYVEEFNWVETGDETELMGNQNGKEARSDTEFVAFSRTALPKAGKVLEKILAILLNISINADSEDKAIIEIVIKDVADILSAEEGK